MIIKKLKLENIRSYENLDITFPIGTTLLSGEIGSGKTSILLGLQFALFGLQPGQKGASILRNKKDNAYTCLEIEVDEQTIVLERSIKKSKTGGITQESNIITIEGAREELSTSEMKNRVIELLNYPKEFAQKSNLLYKFTVYTPQEEMKEIIQEKPETRLDTIRHIFGIDKYKRVKENTNVFLQKIKEAIKIKEVLIGELNILKEKLKIETEKKIFLAKIINNIQIELQNILKEKQEKQENANKSQEQIYQKQKIDSEIQKLKALLDGKSGLEERLKKEISTMQKQISEKIEFSEEQLNEVKNLLAKHKQILDEKSNKFMELNARIISLEMQKENPLKLKEKIMSLENCPTCFQSVSHEHKNKISKKMSFEIEELNAELEQKLSTKQQFLKEIEKEKELIKNYEADKNEYQKNEIKFKHQKEIDIKIKSDYFVLERTSNEILKIKKDIVELQEKAKAFVSLEEKHKETKKQFEEISEKSKQKEIFFATKNKEIELLKIQLEELSAEIAQKEKIKEDLNYLRNLRDWIEDKFLSIITITEKNVLSKLRAEFSTICNEWFSILVSDKLSVRLDEDFTPLITNQDYEIDYEFLSGGERTAVALAYRLALNQVLNSILSKIKTKDIIILDEPTDGFASEQIDKMREIFEQLKAKQIILVSHEQKMEGFVNNVIKIKKDIISSIEK